MINKSLYSSKSSEWATPQALYDKLDKEFNFTLDPCSTENNHKCINYYTIKENGLSKSWRGAIVYCNPPYGRDIYKWIEKAYNENKNNNVLVVLLLPARTDTKWFHEFIYKQHKIEFIKGRLKFNDGKQSAPFPSMIVYMLNKGGNNGK